MLPNRKISTSTTFKIPDLTLLFIFQNAHLQPWSRQSYDDLMAFIRFFAGAKLFSIVKS